ncbi:MAG: hypothetical protein R3324_20215, partial [Halobacteriales archaeon]|nr:hypothetical protein [Halobacteriales archaeon]
GPREGDLDGYSGTFTYFDADGDGAYGDDDEVFLDTDRDGIVTILDVGISGSHRGDIIEHDAEIVTLRLLTAGMADDFRFVDIDGNNRLGFEEPVYLADGSRVKARDIRIAASTEGRVGEQVRPGDDDVGDPLDTLSGGLAYYDEDGSDTFTPGDTLYFDLANGASDEVSVLDIHLTGSLAGEVVPSTTSLGGLGLTDYEGEIAYLDVDGNEDYTLDDIAYLDTNRDGWVTIQDVELSEDRFGYLFGPDDPEVTYRLTRTNSPDVVVFLDDDGDERLDGSERVYLAKATGRIITNTVRLTSSDWGDAGTQVSSRDRDFGTFTIELDADLMYYDRDNDDEFDDEDVLVLDLNDAG